MQLGLDIARGGGKKGGSVVGGATWRGIGVVEGELGGGGGVHGLRRCAGICRVGGGGGCGVGWVEVFGYRWEERAAGKVVEGSGGVEGLRDRERAVGGDGTLPPASATWEVPKRRFGGKLV